MLPLETAMLRLTSGVSRLLTSCLAISAWYSSHEHGPRAPHLAPAWRILVRLGDGTPSDEGAPIGVPVSGLKLHHLRVDAQKFGMQSKTDVVDG